LHLPPLFFFCADDAHGEETFGGKKKMTWVTACIYSGLVLLCVAVLSLGRSTCAKFRACNKISKLLILTFAVLFHRCLQKGATFLWCQCLQKGATFLWCCSTAAII
jgi:hypothetical protein